MWDKRRWRCTDVDCDAKTWTERSLDFDAQAVLTRRAGAEACRRVGEEARPVSRVAAELGVCWWTVVNAVIEQGTPLVDDPNRSVPSPSWAWTRRRSCVPTAPRHHLRHRLGGPAGQGPHRHGRGNAAADLRRWTRNADPYWLAGIEVVATDLAESFRAGLSPHLDHAVRVADPFHVVPVGNRCLDKVRRRVQNETMGHRGRKLEPLYASASCSSAVTSASMTEAATGCCWACVSAIPMTRCSVPGWPRESVRDVHLTDDPRVAAVLLDKVIAGCARDVVEVPAMGLPRASTRV